MSVAIIDPKASGGGSPGGSSGQLQFNNSGAFGGVAGSTWDGVGDLVFGALSSFAVSAASNGVIATFAVGASTKCTINYDGANAGLLSLGAFVAARGGDVYLYANNRIQYNDDTGQLTVNSGASGGGGPGKLVLNVNDGPNNNVTLFHNGTAGMLSSTSQLQLIGNAGTEVVANGGDLSLITGGNVILNGLPTSAGPSGSLFKDAGTGAVFQSP